ncbi:EAL domain-containing protein [Sulfurimonas sp. HSL-1716]|uniref:putative bifunctional diguanylate cyclase/phosphodiesterase n=1 Tax=Hydrocurvibacter sulfurireducens TaxID=3131937 RepID=UPI0031F8FE14
MEKTHEQADAFEQETTLQTFITLINSTIEGLIILDEDRCCIYANSAMINMFKYDKDNILGRDIKEFIAPQCRELAKSMIKIPDKDPYEIWMQRSDGSAFPAIVRGRDMLLAGKSIRVSAVLDISKLKENEDKVFQLAYYDSLTNLPNRQKLTEVLQDAAPMACAILNIDLFKEINDFFGISIGDSILKQVGEWFKEMKISAYRIGGDEFVVLYKEDISWKNIHKHVTNLLQSIEEKVFIVDNETFSIRMTAGIAIGNDKLLTRADIALHRAKEQKKSILLYEEEDNVEEILHKNIAMTATIRDALANNRIICYYQPIVNLHTNTVGEYETLVRLIDSQGNIIPPAEFLALAKKTKLYPAITKEVVRQSCELFSTRKEQFSINLSKSDIEHQNTVNDILEIITETGTASRIIFEILEYEEIENYAEVAEFIAKAKKLGVKIAIDDFGTGYSNFENILNLNVDYIKIDGSLIQGISNNTRHSIIIETIVEFSKKIGAKTIAEFVSSESIYQAVIEHGIDYSQGYFTGKPGPSLLA